MTAGARAASGSAWSLESVCPNLVRLGLVDPEQVLSGGVAVVAMRSRQRCFLVTPLAGPALFVKSAFQVDLPGTPQSALAARHTLAREAAALRAFRDEPKLAAFQSLAPRLLAEAGADTVVLEGWPDARPLSAAAQGAALPVLEARALGRLLGRLVRAGLRAVPKERPRIPLTLEALLHISPTESSKLATAAAAFPHLDALLRHASSVSDCWGDRDGLYHGDARWTNVLVLPGGSRAPRLRLVDWELWGRGDPWWDVATALCGFVRAQADAALHAPTPGRVNLTPAASRASARAFLAGVEDTGPKGAGPLAMARAYVPVVLTHMAAEVGGGKPERTPIAHAILEEAHAALRKPYRFARRWVG